MGPRVRTGMSARGFREFLHATVLQVDQEQIIHIRTGGVVVAVRHRHRELGIYRWMRAGGLAHDPARAAVDRLINEAFTIRSGEDDMFTVGDPAGVVAVVAETWGGLTV